MAGSSKHVFQVVFLGFFKVFSLRDTMVIPTINSLCTRTTRKVNAKVGGMPLFKVISFCEACVHLWVQLGQRRCSIDMHTTVRQVLVVPYVVVVIAFFVGCFLLGFFCLSPGRSLHPLVNLQVLELVKLFDLIFLRTFVLLVSLARVDQFVVCRSCFTLRLDLVQICESIWV